MAEEEFRGWILSQVAGCYEKILARRGFESGITKVNYAGRVFDAKEMISAASAVFDFAPTAGKYAELLKQALKKHFRAPRFLLVNSGSSANLPMVASLCARTAPEPLWGGNEIISPATNFPVTPALLDEHIWLSGAAPPWFGFAMTLRPHIERAKPIRHLEDRMIETRLLFGGNTLCQPGYLGIPHRLASDLREANRIAVKTFFVGAYSGMTQAMRAIMAETLFDCFAKL